MSANPQYQFSTNDLKVTPAALAKLTELVQGEEDVSGVRIYVSGGGCSGVNYGMTFADSANPQDSIVERDGLKIFVDATAMSHLAGVEIDFVRQGMGESFVFRNLAGPAGGKGGCGSGSCGGGGCS